MTTFASPFDLVGQPDLDRLQFEFEQLLKYGTRTGTSAETTISSIDKGLEMLGLDRSALSSPRSLEEINKSIETARKQSYLNDSQETYRFLVKDAPVNHNIFVEEVCEGFKVTAETVRLSLSLMDHDLKEIGKTRADLDPTKTEKGVNRALRKALSGIPGLLEDPELGAFLRGGKGGQGR